MKLSEEVCLTTKNCCIQKFFYLYYAIMFDDSNFSFNANPQSLSKVVRATLE